MNRRTFIETSVAAAVVSSQPMWAAETTHRISRIGLQLYTVRDMMKTDFDGTIAKVAQIGFKEVEFAGYFGKPAKEVRATIDKNGLTSPSGHTEFEVIEKSLPGVIETAHTLGQKYIVCPWVNVEKRGEPGLWKNLAAAFNHAGAECKKADIEFAYHNHAFEFVPNEDLGGKLPYDFLLEETDPKLVKMEMDLCWITVAQKDPLAYFDKYPGRFPLVHVKDWAKGAPGNYADAVGHPVTEGHMTNVGSGTIDWKRIFAQSDKAGIKHYFVENDEAKSFDDPRSSYEYLAKLRF